MIKGWIKVFITTITIFSICFSYAISSFAAYTIIKLTDDSNRSDERPQINNRGEVVWQGGEWDEVYGIFFYDGNDIIQITDRYSMWIHR